MSWSPTVSPLRVVVAVVLVLLLATAFVWLTLDLAVEEGIRGMRMHLLLVTAPFSACVSAGVVLGAAAVVWRWRPSVRLGRIRGVDERGVVLQRRQAQALGLLAPGAALGVALYCGSLTVACLRGPVPDSTVPDRRHAAFWLALVLALVSTGYLVLCAVELAFGRLNRCCVALTPEGVHVRHLAARLHLSWVDVAEVVVDQRGTHLVVPTEKARWRRTSRLAPVGLEVKSDWPVLLFCEIPATDLPGETLRSYHADPDLRSELGDERGLSRIRAARAGA